MKKNSSRERGSRERFEAYLSGLGQALGHVDREEPFRDYCTALVLPGERKSVEPLAAKLAPHQVRSKHQSLHHFVADSAWSDEALLRGVREQTIPELRRNGPIQAWIVDDTGFPKKGTHSVGVARQYCGVLGKQENCRVAVSLSVANERWSLPIAFRLYLPESWANDPERRKKVGVPDDVSFRTKPEIALAQVTQAVKDGVPPGVVLADAGYGNVSEFRDRLIELGLAYAVGILSSTSVWPEGRAPLAPRRRRGPGRPAIRLRHTDTNKPLAAKDLVLSLPSSRFRKVSWREGSAGQKTSRFCALRVRAAHGDRKRSTARDEEWLLIEWPQGESEPTKYWLSNLPRSISCKRLVVMAKLRWRVERDYQELKDELGLDHFEGRGWRGFHHHASLCIAAYAFLAAARGRFSPSGDAPLRSPVEAPSVPRTFLPRGSATST